MIFCHHCSRRSSKNRMCGQKESRVAFLLLGSLSPLPVRLRWYCVLLPYQRKPNGFWVFSCPFFQVQKKDNSGCSPPLVGTWTKWWTYLTGFGGQNKSRFAIDADLFCKLSVSKEVCIKLWYRPKHSDYIFKARHSEMSAGLFCVLR